jgi:hypothetical protein
VDELIQVPAAVQSVEQGVAEILGGNLASEARGYPRSWQESAVWLEPNTFSTEVELSRAKISQHQMLTGGRRGRVY